jgi:hypothetical protein
MDHKKKLKEGYNDGCLVMTENQPTADSPPFLIEESFSDLAQNEEYPPSTFPELSQNSLEEHEQRHGPLSGSGDEQVGGWMHAANRGCGWMHAANVHAANASDGPSSKSQHRVTCHCIQRPLLPRARMTTFQTQTRTCSALTTGSG